MRPLFGSMNQKIALTIARNAPKYSVIVEPFGDGGTFSLFVEKKPASQHMVNIVDETLFQAFLFVQSYSSGDFSALKAMDWVGSQEGFDTAMAISDTEGVRAFYRFVYLKKFGMTMLGATEPSFDILSTGVDVKNSLYSMPLMKALLKKVTFLNEDPLSLIPSDGFMILVPPNDQVDAVKEKLKSLSGSFFFAGPVADGEAAINDAESLPELNVMGEKVASIMMKTYSFITNYESRLTPIDPALYKTQGMKM